MRQTSITCGACIMSSYVISMTGVYLAFVETVGEYLPTANDFHAALLINPVPARDHLGIVAWVAQVCDCPLRHSGKQI